MDVMSMLDTEGAMDIEKLREWAEKSQLDPNDPRNASFFYFIKVRGYTTEKINVTKHPVLVNLYPIVGYGLFLNPLGFILPCLHKY